MVLPPYRYDFLQLLGLLWLLFWGYWLIAARSAKRTVRGPAWAGWIALRLVLAVVIVALQRARLLHGLVSAAPGPVAEALGVALCAAGMGVAVWARRHLGRNWGTPMSAKMEPVLVTSGPYAWVRHPIYAGLLLALAGSALVLGPVWLAPAVLLIAGAYFLYAARAEEALLARQLPEAYPRYRARTRLLIPFVL
ncbi:MAG: isoprenylcysteine carboxylmethyltransferase family protein [Armatimonadetes bacterium]|nr:isoprenylcysteine carboxylmethyltransferase family protein [Armatimonadota bacterium]